MSDLTRTATAQTTRPSQSPPASGLLQRQCACGQHTAAGGECAACRQKRQGALQRSPSGLAINRPGDRYEQEAERVAAAVISGGELPGRTLSSAPALRRDGPPAAPSPRDPSADERRKYPGASLPDLGFNEPKNDQHVQQPSEKPETNEDRLGAAGEKLAETFLETTLGKQLTDQAEKFGEGFVSTLPSLAVSLSIAAGTVATMALRNEEFPLKGLVIKLTKLAPGLKVKLTYKGPLSAPTEAGISFAYEPEAAKKPQMSDTDRTRADTERLAADQAKFQKGAQTPAQRAAEQRQLDAIVRGRQAQSGNILGIPGLTPRRDDRMLQRDAAGSSDLAVAPPIVHDVLSSPGQPLDPATRSFMEPRFGHDFSCVRVHTDGRAAASARDVSANAYTVGRNVVFGAGRFAPETHEGRRLIAHELTHVVQQGTARPTPSAMLRFSTQAEETDAQSAAQAVLSERSIVPLRSAPPSIARAGDRSTRPGPPTDLPTGQKVVIQWGDDYATNMNARALATGARGGPNATGARVIRMEELTEKSLVDVREVAIVIHGESDWNSDGTRVIKEGEAAPRAERGMVGLSRGMVGPQIDTAGPIQQVTPAKMAELLRRAGFTSGRWTTYRVTLVMCYGGVGKTESYGSQLGGEMSSPNVRVEVLGAMGRVDATGAGRTERLPPGQSPSRAAARPQPGVPQVEKHYEPPHTSLNRLPGSGWQRTPARTATPTAPTAPQVPPESKIALKPSTAATKVTTPTPPSTSTTSPTAGGLAVPPSPGAAKATQSPPPMVGRPFQTPSNVAAKEYERAGVRGGAAVLALQGFGMLLTALGNAIQQNAAETAFYAKLDEISAMLEKNPGMGVIVEFVFFRAEPLPDSVILPGDRFDFVSAHPAQSPQDVQPGLYPLPKGTQLHIRRRWIKPTSPAPERQAGPSAETRTPTLIQNAQQLSQALSLIRQNAGVSSTSIVLAFKAATRTFAGTHIDVGGVLLDVPNGVYDESLPKLEQEATASLARRLDALDSALRDLKTRYDSYSREGAWSRFLTQREFELPPPVLLNGASGSAKLAREWLGKKDFEMTRSHLRTGNERARKVEFLLFHYSHGEPHWLEDEP